MYELTCQVAALEPPPPEMQQLLAAVHGNTEAMNGFVQMNAGTISPATYLSAENIGRIMAGAAPAPPGRSPGRQAVDSSGGLAPSA